MTSSAVPVSERLKARVLAANIPSGVRVTSLTVAAGALLIEAIAA